MTKVDLENELARLAREKWGDNAVEALVGALSSIATDGQMSALVAALDDGSYDVVGVKRPDRPRSPVP